MCVGLVLVNGPGTYSQYRSFSTDDMIEFSTGQQVESQGPGINSFVDMEGYCVDFEGDMFCFTCPLEGRVNIFIIGIGFPFLSWVGIRVYKADWWIIAAGITGMFIMFYRFLDDFFSFSIGSPLPVWSCTF